MADPKAKKLVSAISKTLNIFTPSDENAEIFMQWIMPKIKAEDLRRVLYYFSQWQLTGEERWANLWDPVPGLFMSFNSLQKHEYTVRKFGRKWWAYIEKYVANPDYIVKKLSEHDPDIGRMLSTSLGKTYMFYYAKKLHSFFKMWFWLFPRYHNNCGGVIKYGLIQKDINLWGFYCRRCGARFLAEDVEKNSYQIRKYKHHAKQRHA